MGLEASCTATFGAARGEGKALLETAELIFRGPFRLKMIRERDGRCAGLRHGLVDVKIASFDDAHSSMKFVIPASQRETVLGASTKKNTKRAKR